MTRTTPVPDNAVKFLHQISAVDEVIDDNEEEEEIQLLQRKCGWFPNGRRFGLKGGAPGGASNRSTQTFLRLINNRSQATRNICFTNAVVQLIKKTGYATLLRTQFLQFVAGKPASSYQGCKALHSLYTDVSNRERSAALVRKIVAQKSGKEFLANGSQHDSEEFLRAGTNPSKQKS